MAHVYTCKEIDLRGIQIESVYRGDSEAEIVRMIRGKGHTPVRIKLVEDKGTDIGDIKLFQPKVKVKDLSVFCKQLYTMLNAGMPLITALDVLALQTENKTMASAIKAMASQVQTGDVLSSAMKKHPKIFPVLLISMVEAGELTGNLDSVLERMSEHYIKEGKINSKIKGAMMYPMILSILATAVVIFLLVFIMPTFMGMFASSGTDLPAPTRVLLGISDALKAYWYVFIGALVLLIVFFKRMLSTTGGKRAFNKLQLRLPIVKTSVAKIATSRFTRTLSTLLASGIPIIQALESSATVTGNQVVIDGIHMVTEEIKKGSSLSLLLKRVGIFPPMMVSMVGIGEESGALEEMLEKTADYYDEELEAAISQMISVLEPLMIVVMAVVIGFIVISMMMPMFDMFQTIG